MHLLVGSSMIFCIDVLIAFFDIFNTLNNKFKLNYLFNNVLNLNHTNTFS